MPHVFRSIPAAALGLVLAAGLALAQPAPTTAPSITQTPEEIVIEWRSPRLEVPSGPRVNQTSPRTVQLLGEALQREGIMADRRTELVRDLGDTQMAEAAPFVAAALSDSDPRVRATAAQAAGTLSQPALAGDVARLIDDSDPTVRAQATAAHAKLTNDRTGASPVVLKALSDADPNVRLAALRAAATEEEASAIARALAGMPPRLQTAAAEAIARIGSTENASAVVELLRGDVGQQVAAIRALAGLKATAHGPAVVALLDSPHPTVRRAAIDALPALLDAAEARAAAERMLTDADPSVRAAAAAGAAPVQSASVVARLIELLADPYLPVHDAALATLARAGNDEARSAVIDAAARLLDAPQARRRQDASHLLGSYRSDAGLDKQLAMLSTTAPTDSIDAEVIVETVRALGLIGDERARDAVFDLASRGARAVTSQAASDDLIAGAAAPDAIVAAARLGDSRILEPARKIMSANPEMTPAEPRAASAWATGQVAAPGDRGAAGPLTKLYSSEFDADDTKFEALKAIGRLKLAPARSTLATAAEKASSPRLRWIATWSLWRLTGEEQTYTPPESPWRADVAIEALDVR